MTIHAIYASLSRMFDYPVEKAELRTAHGVVGSFLAQHRPECSLGSFADFVAGSSLAALQEEYVATFDFNPATAPYLGHHLFGDNQKKGEYLIGLKQEYRRHGFVPTGNELPDHLAIVFAFLAHPACQADGLVRRTFIAGSVLPGLERLADTFAARQASPWQPVVEAARQICTADCKEVTPC